MRNRGGPLAFRWILTLALLGVPAALPAQGALYEVTADAVRLRRGPSTEAGILATLTRGTQVTLLDRSGEWSRVRHGEQTGYISSQYLRPVEGARPTTPPAAPAPAPPRQAAPPPQREPASPPPRRPAAASRVAAAPSMPAFTVFAGGSLGGGGYGAGFVGGASFTRTLTGSGALHLVVDGSYSRFPRTDDAGGPPDVSLAVLSATASLALTLGSAGPQPFLLAGGGVHQASASTSQAVTPSSQSTTNVGAHLGGGLRFGRTSLEARYILLKGFTPLNLRIGFGF